MQQRLDGRTGGALARADECLDARECDLRRGDGAVANGERPVGARFNRIVGTEAEAAEDPRRVEREAMREFLREAPLKVSAEGRAAASVDDP